MRIFRCRGTNGNELLCLFFFAGALSFTASSQVLINLSSIWVADNPAKDESQSTWLRFDSIFSQFVFSLNKFILSNWLSSVEELENVGKRVDRNVVHFIKYCEEIGLVGITSYEFIRSGLFVNIISRIFPAL